MNTRTDRQILISTDSVKLQVLDQYCIRARLDKSWINYWAQFKESKEALDK